MRNLKYLLIGMAGGLVIVLLALGVIDQVSMHRRLAQAEANIQNIANFVSQRLNQPVNQPAQPKVEEKEKENKKDKRR